MSVDWAALRAADLPVLGAEEDRTYRLGIMGGTFDPIHNGHLVAAEQAFDDLSLDLVVFMPAGRPAFKLDQSVTSGEERFAMTLLATADNPHFVASRFEVDREGVTYTADTLRLLRELYPNNVEFYFITGADAITEIVSWRDAADIARLAHLVFIKKLLQEQLILRRLRKRAHGLFAGLHKPPPGLAAPPGDGRIFFIISHLPLPHKRRVMYNNF